jgi:hypothetical protein
MAVRVRLSQAVAVLHGRGGVEMRSAVAITAVCLLFVACSSSSAEQAASNAPEAADTGVDTGSAQGGGGRDASATTDDASSPAEASQPAADGMTPSPDDSAARDDGSGVDGSGDDGSAVDAPGLEDGAGESGGEAASSQDAGRPDGDAGNWKLVCPNSMPPMTCCTMYCGCMDQRCAIEIQGGFPGGDDCMTWCLTVGPTLKRGPLSTGIQFLVCECSEAGNPAVPFDWHSHCGHALGMNGGTCKY